MNNAFGLITFVKLSKNYAIIISKAESLSLILVSKNIWCPRGLIAIKLSCLFLFPLVYFICNNSIFYRILNKSSAKSMPLVSSSTEFFEMQNYKI